MTDYQGDENVQYKYGTHIIAIKRLINRSDAGRMFGDNAEDKCSLFPITVDFS